jgi:hypothetical protein
MFVKPEPYVTWLTLHGCQQVVDILLTRRRQPMDSSHIATGTITALLASALAYITHWPLQPLDLSTASAVAGLLVAAGGGAVKFYKSRRAPIVEALAPVVSITPANDGLEPARAA